MGCASSKDNSVAAPLPGMGPAAGAGPPRCKLVLLGDSGVGKSCIVQPLTGLPRVSMPHLQRQCRNAFNPDSAVTVGAAFLAHTLLTPSGVAVKFEIWDTAGQERYASLAPLYYRGCTAAVVVFDITSQSSFRRAQHWVGELRRNTGGAGSVVLVLVGNKTDLPAEERAVGREEAEALAESNGMQYLETSAKTGSNVGTLFQLIASRISAPATPAAASAAAAAAPVAS